MDLADYLRILRKHGALMVLVALLAAAVAAGVSLAMPKEYVARTQLFVSTQGQSSDQLLQGSNFTQQRVKSYAEALLSPLVLDPVIADLKLGTTPDTLAKSMSATVPLDTVLIDLEVTDEDPGRAAQIANAVSENFREIVPTLENSSDQASPVHVTIMRKATPPEEPDSPNVPVNTAAGLLLGGLLGMGLALLREMTDTVIRREDQIREVTEETIIGGIPISKDAKDSPLLIHGDPLSPRAESFRVLRTNLEFVEAATQAKSIVFTSSLPSEGKSTTTANLATTISESGSSVCVVEADLRRPRLMNYFGMEGGAGLTTLLIGDADIEDVLQPLGDTGVTLLGSGPIPPNPSELLGSPAMREILARLEADHDYVIIDAPPLLPVTDAAVLSRHAGGVVVVVGSGVVRREQLSKTLQLLYHVDAKVLGLVINKLPSKGPDAYSYYRDEYETDPVHRPVNSRRERRAAAGGNKRNGLRRRG